MNFIMFQCTYSQLMTKIARKEIALNIVYSYCRISMNQLEALIEISDKIRFYRYFVFTRIFRASENR